MVAEQDGWALLNQGMTKNVMSQPIAFYIVTHGSDTSNNGSGQGCIAAEAERSSYAAVAALLNSVQTAVDQGNLEAAAVVSGVEV